MNQKGMIFIEQPLIMRKMVHKEILNRLIGSFFRNDSMPRKNPPCIGVDNEYRFLKAIEEDTVCCFRPDSIHSEEFFPQFHEPPFLHLFYITTVLLK